MREEEREEGREKIKKEKECEALGSGGVSHSICETRLSMAFD